MTQGNSEVRALIDAARAGDAAATDRLLSRYRNYLVALARMSLNRGLRQKVDASDIVQNVMLKAQQGLDGFRGENEEQVVAWLRQILAHDLADTDRRYRRNEGRSIAREQSLEDMVRNSSHAFRGLPAASGTSPSRGAQRRETNSLVAAALAELKPDDRQVIVLRSFEELEWREVARRMGRTPEAVRALWGRAFRRLGTIVEGRRWTAP